MKTYNSLRLNVIAEDDFREKKGMSYNEASTEIGICSLTAVMIANKDGVIVDKERVWMSYGGGAWIRTSGFADVGTVKGKYDNMPVIREAKFNRVSAMTLEEARKAIGACSLTKVALCDTADNIVERNGEIAYETVWLSLSGTYWARVGGNVSEEVGLTL